MTTDPSAGGWCINVVGFCAFKYWLWSWVLGRVLFTVHFIFAFVLYVYLFTWSVLLYFSCLLSVTPLYRRRMPSYPSAGGCGINVAGFGAINFWLWPLFSFSSLYYASIFHYYGFVFLYLFSCSVLLYLSCLLSVTPIYWRRMPSYLSAGGCGINAVGFGAIIFLALALVLDLFVVLCFLSSLLYLTILFHLLRIVYDLLPSLCSMPDVASKP